MELSDKFRVLYVGQYSEGTTSKQRADAIQSILENSSVEIIDIHEPYYKVSRIWRSIGFRYKIGPLINKINSFVFKAINGTYDLIWVDKGVYLNSSTIKKLRASTHLLVHFTPDPAFTFHRSKLFFRSIRYYDFLITTKSYELDYYSQYTDKDKLILSTQGFDSRLHKPNFEEFSAKTGLVFIGHFETNRAAVIEALLKENIEVTLAGIKWEQFVAKHKTSKLKYLGRGVYGKEYVVALQKAKIAWGSLSKWVPELHTTRTFEIPACGTALLTERNLETSSFFENNDVIFYSNREELIDKVKYFMANENELKEITFSGYKRVVNNGYDYRTNMQNLLERVMS